MDQTEGAPAPVLLQAYRRFPFDVTAATLVVALDRERTLVESTLEVVRRRGETAPHLHLDGRDLALDAIALDGEPLATSRYDLGDSSLTVRDVPDRFSLSTRVVLNPSANRGDEGLFELHGKLATQCESEGFRRITFFPDRPDILCTFSVTLHADRERYPVLLSNGHPLASGELDDGRHWVRWEDPFPKPSYLFAIVAGDFGRVTDRYRTGSGREIELNIYADHDRVGECDFAMGALKRALAWEEAKYEREYDLDVYNIVALTGHTGAMENKGLNIFDANGICADPELSTDLDCRVIERIIAHEVFHNWTGNRVTCRDWFQLCLKEGLTRFRDQCFSQDISGPGPKRIEFVRALERNQFPEDDGPAAHPVRPDQYIEIRNFYTGTVYEKGAEVIRMMHCLLGDDSFREGVKRYLERHDGEAVTVEDFVAVMESVGGRDLGQFFRWYQQAGRPVVSAESDYDPDRRSYALTLEQYTAPTPGQPHKAPFHIPVLLGLLSATGEELAVRSEDAIRVDGNWLVELRERRQTFLFHNVAAPPVPSLLRGFSAPVSLLSGLEREELALLWTRDTDPFNRWRSGQALATDCIRELAARWHAGEPLTPDPIFAEAWSRVLADRDSEPGLLAELLALPDEPALSDGLPTIDLDGHKAARDFLLNTLATTHRRALLDRYGMLAADARWSFDAESVGRRALRNGCLELLLAEPDDEVLDLALSQATAAGNMTDCFAALAALCHVDCPQRAAALETFYARWQHKPPVIDKWFNAQALSRMPGALDAILELEQHPALDMNNAPRAMAFYGGLFRQNRVAFHAPDGRGYDLLADRLILVDSVKPGATYWLMPQILQWRRFDPVRREKMRAALEKIRAADISSALYETVSKALQED